MPSRRTSPPSRPRTTGFFRWTPTNRLSEALEAEIWRVKKHGPQYDAYTMPRQARYLGRWIRHSGWYPDRKVRLYDRRKAQWVGDYVHESVKVEGSVGHLDSNLLHFTCDSLSEHLKTMDRYTTLAAEQLIDAGEKVTWGRLIFEPPWTFFRTYFVKLGFLGRRGRPGDRQPGGALQLSEIRQSAFHESRGDSVRTLHVDSGREMRGRAVAGAVFDRAAERCGAAGARGVAAVRGSCPAQAGCSGAVVSRAGGGGEAGRSGACPRRAGAYDGGDCGRGSAWWFRGAWRFR